jgi:hypothetical protein
MQATLDGSIAGPCRRQLDRDAGAEDGGDQRRAAVAGVVSSEALLEIRGVPR